MDDIKQREKKQKFEEDNKDQENQPIKFYGPATSCIELGMLGHTLNGYYIVKSNREQSISNKIQMVYCRFKTPEGSNQSKNNICLDLKYSVRIILCNNQQ